MERELQQKTVEWPAIVEFFTKRGRPLSKDEIQKLVEEDRRAREAEDAKKRADEEAERRRHQRIQNELADEEEYDTQPTRQKAATGKSSGTKDGKTRDLTDSDRLQETRPDAGFDSEDEGDSEDDLVRADDDEQDSYDDEVGSDEDGENDGEEGQDKEKLTKTKLSQKDYIKRAHSAKTRRKGKYGVTVPRPFSGMMDKPKAKTIAQRKFEAMMEEKKREEDAAINYQFRSKPIPPEVLIPRYQTIMEAEQARRQ